VSFNSIKDAISSTFKYELEALRKLENNVVVKGHSRHFAMPSFLLLHCSES